MLTLIRILYEYACAISLIEKSLARVIEEEAVPDNEDYFYFLTKSWDNEAGLFFLKS